MRHTIWRLGRELFTVSVFLIGIIMVSCSSHDSGMDAGSERAISFNAATQSRASETDNSTLSSIGLLGYSTASDVWSATEGSAKPNYFYDMELVRSGSSWSYSPLKYWPATGNYLTFFAYSPYSGDSSVSSNLALSSQTTAGVPTLSYTIENSIDAQVDLLRATPVYDQQRTDSPVTLDMQHALTRVDFTAVLSSDEAGKSYTAKVESIEISDVFNSGTLDLGSGEWNLVTTTDTYLIDSSSGLNTDSDNNVFNTETETDYTTSRLLLDTGDYMFVMPQEFSDDAKLILTVRLEGGEMDETVAAEFVLSDLNSPWVAGQGITYQFTITGKAIGLTILEWEDGGSSTVVDGQNYLRLSETDIHFDKWGNHDARLTIETNIDSWSATLEDQAQAWLILKDADGMEATTVTGESGGTLRFAVEAFADTGDRTSRILITAGTMNIYLTITQDDTEGELSLLLSTSEMIFAGRQYDESTSTWGAPDPQNIGITYSPAQFDYDISMLNYSGGGVGDLSSVIGFSSSSDSEVEVHLEALTPEDANVVANPFFERASRLSFTVHNSLGEQIIKTALVRQIYYSLVLDGPDRTYFMKGGTYNYTINSNSPWVMTVDDPYGVFLNPTLPSSGGLLNTVTSDEMEFTINSAVDNDTQAFITFSSPDNLFPDYTLVIEAQQSIPNSHIVAPGASTTIAVRKPYKLWLTDPDLGGIDIQNDVAGSIDAHIVWQDEPGLISSLSISGEEIDAQITVQTSGTAEGNAVVAFTKGGTIFWSWHIWVTNDDILANAKTITYGGESYIVMDRNLGAIVAEPVYNADGTLDSDATSRMSGLFYQNGRKDPFVSSTSLTSNSADLFRTMYDGDGNVLSRTSALSTSDTPNLNNAIMNPQVFYTGNYGNVSWYGNLLEMRVSLWEVNKTDYDPCPTGWKVPPFALWQGRSSMTYDFQDSYARFDDIGYVPAQGYLFSDFAYSLNGTACALFGSVERSYPQIFLLYSSSSGTQSRPAVAANVRCIRR